MNSEGTRSVIKYLDDFPAPARMQAAMPALREALTLRLEALRLWPKDNSRLHASNNMLVVAYDKLLTAIVTECLY